jgi:hypothetical protein
MSPVFSIVIISKIIISIVVESCIHRYVVGSLQTLNGRNGMLGFVALVLKSSKLAKPRDCIIKHFTAAIVVVS